MSYLGLICQHCYHFLPEEKFLSNIVNDEEKYMGCCINCRDTLFGQYEGYFRRVRNKEVNYNTVYDFKCGCGSVIKMTKYNKKFVIRNHEKTKRHKKILKIDAEKNRHVKTKRHQKNPEAERKKRKEYYLKTKHLTQATVNCECGGTYRSNTGSKKRHEKTKKHQNYFL